ncbi:MAG: TIR domain-containing protein [Clostridiales bacterium]|nr:TIR domain-containing protein [Clostridiales bacterium]
MKLTAFQCPICMSTHFRKEQDAYVCESCGNTYTEKQADSQMFIDLRIANRHRQFAEFSKAKEIYTEIIAKYKDEEDVSSAYWGLLLCDQSVMLEVDNQGQLFPSFYRVKSMPIEETDAYKKLMKYVKKHAEEKLDDYQERINIIESARDKANVIANSSKPYDVFICFKKTQLDSDMVTPDYDVANEIYNELSTKYKVFYSEKSLRNIRVRDFEPNIYYGLYTAKVMLIICSKREFLESHWMKNEWKRFMELNKSRDQDYKSIIPIFIDNFTEEDLPDELAHKQALKYGISLISDIDKTLQKIINPIDKDEEQQKQIEMLMANQKKILEEWSKRESQTIEFSQEQGKPRLTPQEEKIRSILKLAKVNIEDLGNFDEAEGQVRKAQEIDAENYVTWFYKLMIDFKAQSIDELIMHDNFRDSVNYRLFVKYANKAGKGDDVQKLEGAREDFLRASAQKVNDLLQALKDNPNPLEEDVGKIKLVYESLPKEAQQYVVDLKETILNARKQMRENKIGNFKTRLTMVSNKEHPNYDDILKIEEEYENLSEDERDLAGDGYKQVITDASNKMKDAKVQKVQQALITIDNQENPSRDDLIHIEKMYNELEDKSKASVHDYKEIMLRAYDKKYINDAKLLSKYLTKLPTEKVPNRDIYTKLENRYKALPKKYRLMVEHIEYLDDYYDKLIASEGGKVTTVEKQQENIKTTKGEPAKKKKHWLW